MKSRFIPSIGNLDHRVDSSDVLHSAQFIQSDAMFVGDLLKRLPGVYLRELGQPGQPSQLNVGGVDDRSITVLLDARPLRDPITGRTNLFDIPLEYISEIEMQNSAASLFEASNAAGGTINLVSHQYDNNRPITKIRFMQGPFQSGMTDGLFAQNLTRGLNAMVGFQRLATDGRFPNSAYDAWSIRARLRYNITERFNVWASELYNKATTGLNGGIDPDNSPSLYDEVTAVVRDNSTNQMISKHDLTLGMVGKLLPDTVSQSRVLAYYSMIDREYSTGATLYTPTTFSDIQKSSVWGAVLGQQVHMSDVNLELGGEYEKRIVQKGYFLTDLTENYSSVKGRVTLQPFEWLTGDALTRLENLRGHHSLAWSLRLQSQLADGFSIWGGLSRTYRYPTIQELYWADSTIMRTGLPDKESHLIAEVGIRMKTGPWTISLQGFKRRVDDAIVTTQQGVLDAASSLVIATSPRVDLSGAAIDLSLQVWQMQLAGNITYTDYHQEGDRPLVVPRFTSFSELSYGDTFGDHAVDLKLAVRITAVSHHFGLQFIPRMVAFAQQSYVQTPGYSTFDLYGVARIGDAHVSLTWENPLNIHSLEVPYYPLMGANIKLGVNWQFLD